MTRLYSTFPQGRSAAGLLLLRIVVGLAAVVQGWTLVNASGVPAPVASAVAVLTACAGVALLIGAVTPIAAAIVGIAFVGLALGSQGSVYVVTMSAAIVLLGPGAVSLDARLFGRREIVIPDDSPRKDGSP